VSPFARAHMILFAFHRKYASIIPFSRYSELFVESSNFSTPRVFGTPIWNAALKSQEDLWCKKTMVPWLLCGVVCLMKYVLPFW